MGSDRNGAFVWSPTESFFFHLVAATAREGAAGADTGAGTGAAGIQADEKDRSFGEGDYDQTDRP